MPPSTPSPSDDRGDAPQPKKPVRPKRPVKATQPKAVKPAAPAPRKAPPAKAVKPTAPAAVRPAAARPAAARPAPAKPSRATKATPPARPPQATPAEAPPPDAQDPLIGQVVGRCRIEELIGLGRTARVYRAHYEALDDVVAIKILRAEVAKNPLLVERFHSEARAIAKLDNENILKIYDVGTTDAGQHYMVVELLEGEEILDLIQREDHIDAMDALRIVRQAANGLGAAHGMGLVHRDIKPQNLFLREDGTVMVVDFGLAAPIDNTSERVGTPHYMAPEVCKSGTAETASDIYGLGIVLYHLLTGQPPYAGKDIPGILKAHMRGEPLRPERRGAVPKDVGEVVRSLTKHDPLMRPTAAELVERLDAIGGKELRQKESLRKRPGRSRARSAVARRERASKGTPAVALILGAVVILGGLIAVLATGGDDTPPSESGSTTDSSAGAPKKTSGSSTFAKPEETPAERAARENRLADVKRQKEGQEALERAEAWARENWHVPDDTEAVIAKYRYVRDRFKNTKAGDEAKLRVKMIGQKTRHPHPDREWTTVDAVAEARTLWKKARPKVEAQIAALDFDGARSLLPPPVSDEGGRLARELDFWRTYITHLVEYRKAAIREITNIAQSEREIRTPGGDGTIRRISPTVIEVQVGHKTHKYSWADVGPFSDNADLLILQLAFTYAYMLDAFWDAQLELGSASGARTHARMTKAYEKRYREAKEK